MIEKSQSQLDQDSDDEEKQKNFGIDSGQKLGYSGIDIPDLSPVSYTEQNSQQNNLISYEQEGPMYSGRSSPTNKKSSKTKMESENYLDDDDLDEDYSSPIK